MKTTILLIAISQIFGFSNNNSRRYVADVSKSKLEWIGYAEAGGYAPQGTLKLSKGNLTMNKDVMIGGFFEFDMKTITHENKELENHLKNEDFFNVEKYPIAQFTLTKVMDNMVSGVLSIKGISKPITFPITLTKLDRSIQIQAIVKVDRTHYEIKYNSSTFFQDLGSYAIKNNFDFKLDITMNLEKN